MDNKDNNLSPEEWDLLMEAIEKLRQVREDKQISLWQLHRKAHEQADLLEQSQEQTLRLLWRKAQEQADFFEQSQEQILLWQKAHEQADSLQWEADMWKHIIQKESERILMEQIEQENPQQRAIEQQVEQEHSQQQVAQDNFPQLSKNEENHLIAQLFQAKVSGNVITYASLFCAFLSECFRYTQTHEISIIWTIFFTVALAFGNFINQYIVKYRIDHGLYGTSYSEAKEIVSFILEWHRKNGNFNGKPPKLVFTKEELDQCLQVNGGEEYAR